MNHWDNWHSEPCPPPLPLSCRNSLCENGCVTSPLDTICLHPLHTEAHVPGLSVYSSHGLTPDSLSSLLACGYFCTQFMLQQPHSACGLSENHYFMPPHLGSSHLSPQSVTLFWIFPSQNILYTFQYGLVFKPTLWSCLWCMEFQMFHDHWTYSPSLWFAYISVFMSLSHDNAFHCVLLGKTEKKFFWEATFFHLWIPNL